MTQWDPTLELGVAAIDAQHRTLFARASGLAEAVRERRGADEVAAAFGFLRDYVREHFEAEEALMRVHGFPDAEAHARLHERIRRRLAELQEAWSHGGASEALAADVDAMMRGWLSLHIGEKDRAIAEWLHARGVAVRG